ncbi:MAG TPA: PQQ-dependent sugar dehydrogenase [Fimbriimonadales bacterium]|nr:PQQ-dependent sugar dehydrogenase [Fimbriimonadales bacterium]
MVRVSVFLCVTIFAGNAFSQNLYLNDYYYEPYFSGFIFPTSFACIGEEEFLVLEIHTGRVIHLKEGNKTIALDLDVSNNAEQGLLGIALHPNFITNGVVALFYSKNDQIGKDGGNWIDNRVETFSWDGEKLNFLNTLITFPYDPDQKNGPTHDGGKLTVGKDGHLYITHGDFLRGGFENPRIEMNTSETDVAGVGGIYRISFTGEIPRDNPFYNNSNPQIQSLYTYGLRNCFGIATDPYTGRIWATDNGPDQYDEVDIIGSGFNGGWLKICGPDVRASKYAENNYTDYDANDLVYLPNAYYDDPVFSWLQPIGVTQLVFLDSYKFSPQERGNVLIGEFNYGGLYLFEVNTNRNGFVLGGALADKVADNSEERNLNKVGDNWGIIVDMTIGNDGYLYLLRFETGEIYRIRPYQDPVIPKSFDLKAGKLVNGTLTDIQFSDDSYMIFQTMLGRAAGDAQIEVFSVAPPPSTKTLTELQFFVESKSFKPLVQTIELYNYETQKYQLVSLSTTTSSDNTTQVSITSDINRFIEPLTREIKARVSWYSVFSILSFQSAIELDNASWKFIYK